MHFGSTKKIKLISATFLIALLSSGTSSASECASISLKENNIGGDGYLLTIVDNNGERVKSFIDSAGIAGEDYQYFLAEGKHTLLLEQWPTADYKLYKRYMQNKFTGGKKTRVERKLGKLSINSKTIHLNAKANHVYHLNIEDNSIEGSIDLQGQEITQCNASTKTEVLTAKSKSRSADVLENKLLPNALEYRLRGVMTKINQHHLKNGAAKTRNNMLPKHAISYLGTILHKKYVNNAIKVLNVIPYSFANELGLKRGDLISEFSGQSAFASDKSPLAQLTEYLTSIDVDEKISMKIKRQEQELTLERKFTPIVTPQASYQVGLQSNNDLMSAQTLVNSSILPKQLKFEFDQTMLAIKEFYQSKNIERGLVNIRRDKAIDANYGLSGKMAPLKNSTALHIANVAKNSPAMAIGLQTQDVLLTINNEVMQGITISEISNKLGQLNYQKEYSLEVLRNDERVELKAVYSPKLLASFKLDIDLSSAHFTQDMLASIKKQRDEAQFETFTKYYMLNNRLQNNNNRDKMERASGFTPANAF